MKINLRHTGIVVKNLTESINFYCDLLGFKIIKQQNESGDFIDEILGVPNTEVITIKMKDNNGNFLELLDFKNPPKTANPITISSIGLTHIALSVENINALYKKLINNNIEFISKPKISKDGFAKVAFCKAPEDIFIELVEVLKREI